jgi:DNA-binding response OmpR family regulator
MITRYSEVFGMTSQVPLTALSSPGAERTARIHSTFSSVRADQFGGRNIENGQLALVRFQNSHDETLIGLNRDSRTAEVLLLPWTWKELVSRVRSEKRGLEPWVKSNVMRFGRVRVELSSMEVWRGELSVKLTAMEFKVLSFLLRNPKRVISRDHLLNEVWGYDNYPYTRTVDNHIMRLRRKLEPDPAKPIHFRTMHGIGYKFVP